MRLLKITCLTVVMAMTVACEPPELPPSSPPATETETPITAQEAKAGVGKQGQSLADDNAVQKIFSGPVKALFDFKQKAVFDLQIAPALKLFKASNGRTPKSHSEFMEQIVEANRIQLPELPDGAVYRYLPEKDELWVFPESEAPN